MYHTKFHGLCIAPSRVLGCRFSVISLQKPCLKPNWYRQNNFFSHPWIPLEICQVYNHYHICAVLKFEHLIQNIAKVMNVWRWSAWQSMWSAMWSLVHIQPYVTFDTVGCFSWNLVRALRMSRPDCTRKMRCGINIFEKLFTFELSVKFNGFRSVNVSNSPEV